MHTPGNTFEVQDYEVQIQPHYSNKYDLFVRGPKMSHGIQHSAVMNFKESPSGAGVVTNVRGQNFDGQRVYAYMKIEFFDRIYKLLQTEKPVYFSYNYESGDSTTRNLNQAQLRTSNEPLGEGPKDVDS